jgi:hypothetical protein
MDCGAGHGYCNEGQKCSRDGKHCIAQNTVDCGSHFCGPGMQCGSNNSCLAQGAVDCGGGRSCPAGDICLKGGAECITPAALAQRVEAEKAAKRQAQEIKQQQASCVAAAPKSISSNDIFLWRMMCDPQQDQPARSLAAIALGLDPNRIGLAAKATQPQGIVFNQQQFDNLKNNIVTLTPQKGPSTTTKTTSQKGEQLYVPAPSFHTLPATSAQSQNLWGRIGRAVDFANNAASTDPNFKSGASDIAVEGTGCAAGAVVGALAGGVGAGPGCLAGAALAGGAYTAGQAVAEGIKDLTQHGATTSATEAAQQMLEFVADKGSDKIPVSSTVKVAGSWGTYFLYGFYNNSSGP